MDYEKWTFRITCFIFLFMIITYYYDLPKSELDIFFDSEKSTNSFIVSNIGNKPLTNIKIAYKLDCQKIKYTPQYISKEIPTLTQTTGPEPFYTHNLDNLTASIIKNSKENSSICINTNNTTLFIPYSDFRIKDNYYNISDEINYSKELAYNYNSWYCDICNLNIYVNTNDNKTNKNNKFQFINPVQLNITTFCLNTPEDKKCYHKLSHNGPGNISLNFSTLIKQNYENSEGVTITTKRINN